LGGMYEDVRGRIALRSSSSGTVSGSSRARFTPWAGRDGPASGTRVSSVDAEEWGGLENRLGKEIEPMLSLLEIGTDLFHDPSV